MRVDPSQIYRVTDHVSESLKAEDLKIERTLEPVSINIFFRKPVLWITCLSLILLFGKFSTYGKTVKVALIYTVTTPELKEDMLREVKKELGNVEIMNYEIPSVFEEIKSTGYVTALPAARLIGIYMKAIEDGADAILSICSTAGDIAYSMQDAAKYIGVPIIIVNEEMCREAVRTGTKIALMATFQTSIDPTLNIISRVSREMGKHVETREVIVEGGFGLAPEQFRMLMAAKAKTVADWADVIIFTQGSMAYCEEYIANMYHKVVLSNLRFGAKALKTA